MPNGESGVTKYQILDGHGMATLLATVFDLVESNYIRRETYESDIRTLVGRIDSIDADNVYPFSIDQSTGNLVLTAPDDAVLTATINAAGELIITTDDDELANKLEKFSFDIGQDGNLYMTVA